MLTKMEFHLTEKDLSNLIENHLRIYHNVPCGGSFKLDGRYTYIGPIDVTYTPEATEDAA